MAGRVSSSSGRIGREELIGRGQRLLLHTERMFILQQRNHGLTFTVMDALLSSLVAPAALRPQRTSRSMRTASFLSALSPLPNRHIFLF